MVRAEMAGDKPLPVLVTGATEEQMVAAAVEAVATVKRETGGGAIDPVAVAKGTVAIMC